MEEIINESLKPNNLTEDFNIFCEKLDNLPEEIKPQFTKIVERLDLDLSLENLQKDPQKVQEFYDIFAEFTEASNPFKMLYQVLLDEYFKLGIFTKTEHTKLKTSAGRKIKQLLWAGKWAGGKNFDNRTKFRNEMLREIRQKVHEKAAERAKNGERIAALCFSGGGIRSATFGLGILQGLAKHKLLSRFDYISTVSGGGYIGSWLSAWIHRISDEKNEFTESRVKLVEEKLIEQTADQPEPPEITHLRSYSNYMSPRTGLFSVDTWTLVAVYLRNLLLNWTVFVPLIAAFLLLPKMFTTFIGFKLQGPIQYLFLIAAIITGLVGVININAMRPSLKDYSWVDQTYKENEIGIIKSVEGKVIWWVLVWILISAVFITIFWVWNGGIWHFPISPAIADRLSLSNPTLIDFILFSEIFFIGGYILVRIVFRLRKFFKVPKNEPSQVNSTESIWKRVKHFLAEYVPEFLTSIVSGAFGGGLLYLVVDNLGNLNSWLYGIFAKTTAGDTQLEIQKVSQQLLQQEDKSLFVYLFSILTNPASVSETQTGITPQFWVCFGVPLYLLVFLLAATLFVGFSVRFTDDEDREWMARFGAWILIFILGWIVISTAVIFGPEIFSLDWKGSLLASIGGLSGLVTLILGFSSKSSEKNGSEPKSNASFLLWFAPAVAAPIFVLFLIILISYGTDALINKVGYFENFRNLTWFGILAAIGAVMGIYININKFSFHSIYRERLIRAYLGASRTEKRLKTANSFTGLDSENDNIEMRFLKHKPFHVVNMTLNLVKTHNLRWQNRKAESFTATALYCGSSNMGEGSGNYRSSEEYGFNSQNGRAITLGTAAAISGAAASPNMGYYTMSSAVSFLMVLFNVRLGWWLGNPGRRGDQTNSTEKTFFQKYYFRLLSIFNLNKTYNQPAPRWSPRLFFDESIGGTDDSKPYVYLSDGGHFENLGLYEMVLRRCHLIVVSDAGCDKQFGFSDFGTAIHKIRVDMGIPIEFEKGKFPTQSRNCGIGKIRYSCVDGTGVEDGLLIYIKPTLDGDEPIDLKNYKTEHIDFPHESTADQMYSETQFESYRSLGFHQINSICCLQTVCNCKDLSNLETNAKNYLDNLPK